MIANLRGSLVITLFTVNIAFWCLLVVLCGLLKAVVPLESWRRPWARWMMPLVDAWSWCNQQVMNAFRVTRFDISGLEGLSRDEWYLVISNHQSWSDILVLQSTFLRRIPMLKFFLKRELKWVPFVGISCWALDFPFMQRYPKELLEAHPELRRSDLEATRRACELFRHTPTSILNFVEGTRFTREKHAHQESPYRHLLQPKTGGLAFVIGAMGERIRNLVNVTIFYPGGAPTFWEFCCGKRPRVEVRIHLQEIPEGFSEGDYQDDPTFRERFRAWVHEIWQSKDHEIAGLSLEHATPN
ncbi:MAG: acyltransferase [Gammaproteobacteria bacterium]|jgi:1-acyl-sn-glycerol-3-phosphate acyltransferase